MAFFRPVMVFFDHPVYVFVTFASYKALFALLPSNVFCTCTVRFGPGAFILVQYLPAVEVQKSSVSIIFQ